MAFVSKDKDKLEMARVEYLKGILPPNDVARQFNLKPLNFRRYLSYKGEIKPEHTNKKTQLVKNALQAIDEVQKAEIVIPAVISDFQGKADKIKGEGLDFAENALNALNTMLKNIDKTDIENAPKIETLTKAFKSLVEVLGLYPKAPTIAIQNNLQQNLQTQTQGKEKKLRLIFDEEPKNERD